MLPYITRVKQMKYKNKYNYKTKINTKTYKTIVEANAPCGSDVLEISWINDVKDPGPGASATMQMCPSGRSVRASPDAF